MFLFFENRSRKFATNTALRIENPSGERKGNQKENKGFVPRPVMKRTSEFEVRAFVSGYKVNGEVPICGNHVNHATRYWTIVALHKKFPKDFTIAELSRHFGICGRVFRGEYIKKIHGRMEDYNYLSPSENMENSRKATIKKYGRAKDLKRYMERKK